MEAFINFFIIVVGSVLLVIFAGAAWGLLRTMRELCAAKAAVPNINHDLIEHLNQIATHVVVIENIVRAMDRTVQNMRDTQRHLDARETPHDRP